MPLPSFSRLVAYVTGLKSEQVNWLYDEVEKIALATILADYRNTETISATKTLANADAPIQRLTPSVANRDVALPTAATTNHPFFIRNSGTSYKLLIKSGATTLAVLAAGQSALFISDGSAWAVAGDRIASDAISGLQLQWVSTTALTVGTGFAVLADGTRVTVSSAIAKSSLSLSANTWYHVYLYLNGANADVEIVTTAPASPYLGTARAKTGDTSRRYLGSVRTDGSGILQFVMSNTTILYVATASVLSNGTATTVTSIDLSSFVPTTSNMAIVYFRNMATNATIVLSSNAIVIAYALYNIDGLQLWVPKASFGYNYDAAPNGGAYANVAGYLLER